MITLRSVIRDEAGGGDAGGGTPPPAGGGRSLIGDAGAPPAGAPAGTPPAGDGGKPVIGETWWKGWIKEDGSLDKGRLAHLPEELRGDKALLERFGKFDDLAKSYVHAAKTAREKGLMPLREGATEAEKTDFLMRRAKLNGAPDKPEGYGIKRPDNLPEEAWNENIANRVAKAAHARGLSAEDVQTLFNAQNEGVAEELSTIQAEQAKASEADWKAKEKALNDAFGANKAERIKEAVAGARWAGVPVDAEWFVQNPEAIIAFAKVYSKIGEAKFVDGQSGGDAAKSAKDEIQAMANDPSHKYYAILRDSSMQQRQPALYQEAIAHRRKIAQQLDKEVTARR